MFDLNGLVGGGLGKIGDYVKKSMGVSDCEHPFSSCPSACIIAPDCCEECAKLKAQVKQAVYYVNNEDEYYAQFEVCETVSETERRCPSCGAPLDEQDVECEYCGADLSAGNKRIRVRSKQDIPSPIKEAYNKIHARQMYIITEQKKRTTGGGLLKGVINSLGNMSNQLNAVEKTMTLAEIETAANEYGVSVGTYLEGLDDNTYLTIYGKRALEQLERQREENRRRAAENSARINATVAARPTSSGGPLDLMQRHAQHSSGPGYVGKSSSSCCGNCQYYLMGTNECGNNHFKHPSGASDYCGSYRSM